MFITDFYEKQAAAAAENPPEAAKQGDKSVLEANFTKAFISCMNFRVRLTKVLSRCGIGDA